MDTAVISGDLKTARNASASRSRSEKKSARQSKLAQVVAIAPEAAPMAHASELKLSALSSFIEQLKSDELDVLIGNDGPHLAIVLVDVNQCERHGGFWRNGWCPTCAAEKTI